MLEKISGMKGNISDWLDDRKERSDFLSWLAIVPYKKIMNNRNQYIELSGDYGYLQLLEIPGKDITNLGKDEQQSILLNYHTWLVQFQYDFEIYTTKLPTDTKRQVAYLNSCLNLVRSQLKKTADPRLQAQLRDKKNILEQSIKTEVLIQKQIYNSEFILFLYGKTVKELDDIVSKAMNYGNQDFVPKMITREKKEKILEQINNMNEKV